MASRSRDSDSDHNSSGSNVDIVLPNSSRNLNSSRTSYHVGDRLVKPGQVRHAAGYGQGYQKVEKTRFTMTEDLQMIEFAVSHSGIAGHGAWVQFCKEYKEIARNHSVQSLRTRMKRILKKLDSYAISAKWKYQLTGNAVYKVMADKEKARPLAEADDTEESESEKPPIRATKVTKEKPGISETVAMLRPSAVAAKPQTSLKGDNIKKASKTADGDQLSDASENSTTSKMKSKVVQPFKTKKKIVLQNLDSLPATCSRRYRISDSEDNDSLTEYQIGKPTLPTSPKKKMTPLPDSSSEEEFLQYSSAKKAVKQPEKKPLPPSCKPSIARIEAINQTPASPAKDDVVLKRVYLALAKPSSKPSADKKERKKPSPAPNAPVPVAKNSSKSKKKFRVSTFAFSASPERNEDPSRESSVVCLSDEDGAENMCTSSIHPAEKLLEIRSRGSSSPELHVNDAAVLISNGITAGHALPLASHPNTVIEEEQVPIKSSYPSSEEPVVDRKLERGKEIHNISVEQDRGLSVPIRDGSPEIAPVPSRLELGHGKSIVRTEEKSVVVLQEQNELSGQVSQPLEPGKVREDSPEIEFKRPQPIREPKKAITVHASTPKRFSEMCVPQKSHAGVATSSSWNLSPIQDVPLPTDSNYHLRMVTLLGKMSNLTPAQTAWALFVNNGVPLDTLKWLVEYKAGTHGHRPTYVLDHALLTGTDEVIAVQAERGIFTEKQLRDRLAYLQAGCDPIMDELETREMSIYAYLKLLHQSSFV